MVNRTEDDAMGVFISAMNDGVLRENRTKR